MGPRVYSHYVGDGKPQMSTSQLSAHPCIYSLIVGMPRQERIRVLTVPSVFDEPRLLSNVSTGTNITCTNVQYDTRIILSTGMHSYVQQSSVYLVRECEKYTDRGTYHVIPGTLGVPFIFIPSAEYVGVLNTAATLCQPSFWLPPRSCCVHRRNRYVLLS